MTTLHRIAVALAAAAALGGCAQYKLGEPVPSVDAIRSLRASQVAPVALGEFRLAAGKNSSIDRGVMVRTNMVESPYERSFALYLKHALAADLGAAGLLDDRSGVMISAELTDSALDVPVGTGSARVAARFVVTRSGRKVFERELAAQSAWPSSFVGVTALITAINEYGLLYRKLVAQLIADPQFVEALRAR